MKRALIPVLSFFLWILLVSVSSAAVSVGGNFRAWYQTAEDESLSSNSSISTFRFDRIAFKVTAEVSQTSGFAGGIQFFQIGKNSNDGNSKVDIRVDSGYYYQKAILSDGDELDFGYFKLPFGIEKGFQIISLDNSLSGQALGPTKKSIGLKYQGKAGTFGYAFAVANANNGGDYNQSSDKTSKGFDTALRLTYGPLPCLKMGLGYMNDVVNSSTANSLGVFDVTCGVGPFNLSAEYVSVTPDSLDAMTGVYGELSCRLSETFSVYTGRAVSLSGENNGKKLIEYLANTNKNNWYILGSSTGTGYNFAVQDNWTLIGAKYQLATKTALQAEFLQQDDDKAKRIGGIRLMVEF